jgi:lipoprotein NlpD
MKRTMNRKHMVSKEHGSKAAVAATMALAAALSLLLGACSTPATRAPVEERTVGARSANGPGAGASAPTVTAAMPADPAKPLPGAENAGKPGYYMVKPGDTLIRIGLENGQNWKDLVRWNGLENPNLVEVGQVLRVVAPGVDPSAASTRAVVASRVDTRPLDARPATAASGAAAASSPAGANPAAAATAPTFPAPAPLQPPPPPAAAREADDDVNWAWPSAGPVMAPFDEGRVKGLVIGGRAGDPVLAAADGRVVYAGSGLRGYGNLIIVKHNNTYLTAYAHNQALLVKEDQTVRRGQKIAEMGSTDADGVKLHFEVRRQGKPIDPAKLLPPR